MYELALFAGAGGGILGSVRAGHTIVCAVERDPHCIKSLQQRQRDGYLPPFPIWTDVRTFDGKPWRGKVDIITAGFPCQPFSTAGTQLAADDERNAWPATRRIISEVRSPVLLENVPALLTGTHGYFGNILSELAQIGYDAIWDCIPASTCGAPHQRDRLWVYAYPHS
jgi:DNA (cytosine-5)-methyltransferase 1